MRDRDDLHAWASRAYSAIFSKNRFFGTTHGDKPSDKPTSQNGISLRSPSLIMAPGKMKNEKIYRRLCDWGYDVYPQSNKRL